MIAVDTSALMAIVLAESEADACIAVLEADSEVMISAAALAELLIVAGRRNVEREALALVAGLGLDVVAVTEATARRVAQAYASWGKGTHPAGLNLIDCFSYDVAKTHECPLLFVGNDFSRTDLRSVLQGGADHC
jgi:ribonuclease VapC